MLTVIFIILIIIGLAAIAWVIIPKFPQLRSLEVEETAQDKLKRLKKNLIVGRILRQARELEQRVFSRETRARVSYLMKDSYTKLKTLEDRYRTHTAGTKVQLLLKRGEANIVDDPEFAEKCFLDVISLDARNLSAYEGLSRIYLEKQSLDEAIQVLEFLIKLNPGAAHQYLFDIAEAYLKGGNLELAATYGERARNEEPENPKYLDFLTEVAILGGDKKAGEKYLEKLREVNPENAKIDELQKRLEAIE